MKPWGPLPWLLDKLQSDLGEVVVVGAIGCEERCLGSLLRFRRASRVFALEIADPPSRYTERTETKTSKHMSHAVRWFGHRITSIRLPLLSSEDRIAEFVQTFSASSTTTLVLDITCLPKRFFFLMTKLVLLYGQAKTVIVTYTQPRPGGYTEAHLAENPSGVSALPGFGPLLSEQNRLAIAVGFETLGLPQILDDYKQGHRTSQVVIIVPFPPGQPYSRRIWQCVNEVGYPGESNVRRVPALDAFRAANSLVMNEGATPGETALAPYGPKPISLGMCLYGIATEAPVFYTQPLAYHPDYTKGIGTTWGYCLRIDGEDVWRKACGLT